MTPRIRHLGLPALLLVAAGCGSSGPAASSTQGAISVHLMKAPGDFFQGVDLHILTLEAHSNTTGWVTLSEPDATYDLMQLRGGVVETLASGVALEPGKYTQFRLVLGPGQNDPTSGDKISNLVVLNDGTAHDLTVPSGLQTGVKLVCQVDVQPGASVDVFIDFEIPQSIHLHETGASANFILRPVIHCRQGPGTQPPPPPAETGTITGELHFLGATEAQEPLVGVTVTAQVLDTAGKASIVGSTTTDATGFYTLDNLPLGSTYYVVTQPVMVVPGTPPAPPQTLSWAARASLGLLLDAANPTDSFTDFLGSPDLTGSVAGTIATTTPNSADVVNVRQLLHPALNPITVIVRTADVQVSGGTETFSIGSLPAAPILGTDYSLDATRPGGVFSNSVNVTVMPGLSAPVTLTFP